MIRLLPNFLKAHWHDKNMTKQACFTVAVRAHELHMKKFIHTPIKGELKTFEEISWYFLFLWAAQ